MRPRVRAGIAAAVIAHSSGRQVASVHDHELQEQFELQAQAMGARIACYDLALGSRLSGELPNLVQSPDGSAIQLLMIDAGEYRGFDHGSQTHFNVRPEGLSAQLYDYGDQRWFAFTAHPATF